MADLQVDVLELGMLPTNTYLVSDRKTGECLIIDPSDDPGGRLKEFVKKKELKPSAVFLTHGHDDHIGLVNELKRDYGILSYIGKEEEEFVESTYFNLSQMFGHPRAIEPDLFVLDGQEMKKLGTHVQVIGTPGHTVGGVCYYFPDEGILFSGDTLFRESVGRSDFPGGNTLHLIASVKRLMELPDDVKVYPGHGDATTIGHERVFNPYCRGGGREGT